ncbi:tripartite tricarboxylate transporter substrate binding protein [Nitratireductor aquimarinus]|uniref:tripartite tricarboxylate transporter substrate binding protein n=1 Tax=Nitratireductor TaxID=245876 RepID=UPI0019D33FF4|nr:MULTISPECIES: tripartite tricarboxylate transporter substrate binding protein [Nitratireductor]MBN7776423.1 tripartite tricarboxylate transporter substrate binding protein [Nitratireductor pacificus]MBN7779290.1 tripartite tricarboxylate transporter substrate binding protein [Nitratireductor pacificus]MBN7788097.1 tripartite tricarboxylate transporter substrate binding protein [Nitratireductor aquimarinus]MBY6098144.1 tripartite tricarboxylate transporter substrate binding protein [Nitratire
MNSLPKFLLRLGALTLAATVAAPAMAEYPEKPVTIIVGFGAGGGVDTVSRAAANALGESLGQPVTIKNQPGAGGGLATTALKAMPADGYNIVATTSTTLTFDPHAQDLAFSVDDFDYIAAFGVFPEALISLPSRGWNSLADTVAEAKSKGEPMSYASTTSVDRVVLGMIAEQDGVTLNPTPTKGGAEAVAQTLGGHVDFAYSSGTYYAQAEAGNLQVLAVFGDERIDGFPDTPTLQELGYDISSMNMVLFLVPKDTPDEVKAKLTDAFGTAAKDPRLLETLEKRNMGSFVPVGEEISTLIHKQSDQFRAAVEASK